MAVPPTVVALLKAQLDDIVNTKRVQHIANYCARKQLLNVNFDFCQVFEQIPAKYYAKTFRDPETNRLSQWTWMPWYTTDLNISAVWQ